MRGAGGGAGVGGGGPAVVPPSAGDGPAPPSPSAGPLADWEGCSAEAWGRRLAAATVEFHATVSSTNDRAGELVGAGAPTPAVVVADRQSAGRGRRGRRWVSDTPRGLWFTVAWEAGEAVVGGLPLRVGLGVAGVVESVAPGLRVAVKWPNDLVVDGRKLGGILCERRGEHALVGVGLNLNHEHGDFPIALRAAASSIRLLTGRPVPRAEVLAKAVAALARIRADPRPEIPGSELAELRARSPLTGRALWIDGIVRHSSGRPRAVDGLPVTAGPILADGSLEVRDASGGRLRFIAGTVRRRTTSGS